MMLAVLSGWLASICAKRWPMQFLPPAEGPNNKIYAWHWFSLTVQPPLAQGKSRI
jgi:hypothetical protein